jgi:hypothetical protein
MIILRTLNNNKISGSQPLLQQLLKSRLVTSLTLQAYFSLASAPVKITVFLIISPPTPMHVDLETVMHPMTKRYIFCKYRVRLSTSNQNYSKICCIGFNGHFVKAYF